MKEHISYFKKGPNKVTHLSETHPHKIGLYSTEFYFWLNDSFANHHDIVTLSDDTSIYVLTNPKLEDNRTFKYKARIASPDINDFIEKDLLEEGKECKCSFEYEEWKNINDLFR